MNEDVYTCAGGESFDLIALMLYGHEKYTHYLLEANPQYAHKLVMDGGEELSVPELPGIQVGIDDDTPPAYTKPPWKR